jgi:hypothetical protein
MENENLNLVDILKDCPRGIKLYSTVYGEVEFIRIRTGIVYPIECEIIKDKTNCIFTKEGKILSFYDNECTLFPSKDQRDWSKFNIESKFDINTLQHFDKVIVRDHNKQMWKCDFYNSHVKELNTPFKTITSWYKQCIPYNEETKHLVDTNEIPPKKYINWKE